MGWSEHGANQMCKLRCYKENGGNIIELVQMQKELKATGTEDAIANKTLRDLFGKIASKTYKKEDYYINRIQASIPGYNAMKQISISTHLSNL